MKGYGVCAQDLIDDLWRPWWVSIHETYEEAFNELVFIRLTSKTLDGKEIENRVEQRIVLIGDDWTIHEVHDHP